MLAHCVAQEWHHVISHASHATDVPDMEQGNEIQWKQSNLKVIIVTKVFLNGVQDWLKQKGTHRNTLHWSFSFCVSNSCHCQTLVLLLKESLSFDFALSLRLNFFLLHTAKGHSAQLSQQTQKLHSCWSKYLTLLPSFMVSAHLCQCFRSSS